MPPVVEPIPVVLDGPVAEAASWSVDAEPTAEPPVDVAAAPVDDDTPGDDGTPGDDDTPGAPVTGPVVETDVPASSATSGTLLGALSALGVLGAALGAVAARRTALRRH